MTEHTQKPTAQRLRLAADTAEKWLEFTALGWKLKKSSIGKTHMFMQGAPLSHRQYRIITALEFTNLNTISALAQAMALNKSTLSITMSKMIDNGLVETFEPDGQTDGRKTFFRVSDKGREIIMQQFQHDEAAFTRFYHLLNYRQKTDFEKGVDLLQQAIHQPNDYIGDMIDRYAAPDTDEKTFKLMKSLGFFMLNILERLTNTFGSISKTSNGKNICSLTDHQLYLLFCIHVMKHNTISMLESLTGASTSTLSIAVRRLADKGLVEKHTSSEGDGRVVYISITENTKQMFERVLNAVKNHIANFFAYEYSDSELKKIIRGIKYLCRVFDDDALIEKMRFA